MKEIKVKVENTYIKYQAVDGTVFDNKEECDKYEKSAKGVIFGKLKKLIVNDEYDAWTLLGGYEETTIIAVKLKVPSDKDTLLQALFLENSWLLSGSEGAVKRKTEIESIVEQAYKAKDVVLLGQNCDGEYYVINSRQNIINNLLGLDAK